MKRTPSNDLPVRVPYPQTPRTSHAWLRAHGQSVAGLARHHRMNRYVFVDLLLGRQKGLRGQSHRAAIILGLKPEPKP